MMRPINIIVIKNVPLHMKTCICQKILHTILLNVSEVIELVKCSRRFEREVTVSFFILPSEVMGLYPRNRSTADRLLLPRFLVSLVSSSLWRSNQKTRGHQRHSTSDSIYKYTAARADSASVHITREYCASASVLSAIP